MSAAHAEEPAADAAELRRRAARVEALLVLLLRLAGLVCLAAAGAAVMPRQAMADIHAWLGLGTFPAAPITEYLARMTSSLCALYGAALLWLVGDVRRYAPLIRLQAWAIPLAASLGGWLAWRGGMPLWWAAGDAAACWLYCLPTLGLLRRWRRLDAASAGPGVELPRGGPSC